MFKLYSLSLLAVIALVPSAAFAQTTLSAGNTLNLTTGAVGTGTSGGDLAWNGTTLTPQAPDTAADLAQLGFTGSTSYGALTSTEVSAFAAGGLLSPSPITPSVNDVIAVQLSSGSYAAVLVIAINGTSITVQFKTLGSSSTGGGGGTTPTGPNITGVVNNYSYIPPGFPNSGVSPSSIILVFGSGMAQSVANLSLNPSNGAGIPTTSAGATFTVADSSGKTYNPGIYYAAPSQAALVLPAKVAIGNATITVSYNGQTSNSFQFQVVPSALGLDTYYGTGSGLVAAINSANGDLYSYTSSASPGETILLYGSGLGADPADSDTVFTSTPHSVNANTKVYIGGIEATVTYAGSSGYPGLNQINVVIPSGVSGCYVGLVVTTGSGSNLVTSNFGSIPINQNSGQCNDSIFGTSGQTISILSSQTNVKYGDLLIGQITQPATPPATGTTTTNYAFASFQEYSGATFATSGGSAISIGSCSVTEVVTVSGTIPKIVGLDAGTISLAGPNGNYTLTELEKGIYEAGSLTSPGLPAGAIPSTGGAFTFNGGGGADVGSFKSTINFPNPILQWTNQSAAATVNIGSGLLVTWTGGTPGSYVIIEGSSSNTTTGATGSYICFAPQSALQFQVPNYVTGALPAGTGSTTVENSTSFVTFTATGIDYGVGYGFSSTLVNTTYQ